MFCHALSLQGVYSSILYKSFYSKMQKKQYLHVHWQKIAQQGWKIAQKCVSSVRFSNYGDISWYNHSWLSYSTNICIWISICYSMAKPIRKHQENLSGIILTEFFMAQSWQSCDDERSSVRLRDCRSVAAGGCGRAQHSWSLIFG